MEFFLSLLLADLNSIMPLL